MPTTLVILHDELEAPLGKLRVRRGGAEQFSLRGHKGLISVLDTLRKKGLYPPKHQGHSKNHHRTPVDAGSGSGLLSILRVGVGIGRPSSREPGSVADYVLTEMNQRELGAVRAAADGVVDVLVQEVSRG